LKRWWIYAPLDLVLAAPVEVLQDSSRIERVGIDLEQRQVGPDRRGLHLQVPALEVFAPKLALEHSHARREPPPDLGVSVRELLPHLLRGMANRLPRRTDGTGAEVGEAIDKARLQVFQ
jgi:hypothetical protein